MCTRARTQTHRVDSWFRLVVVRKVSSSHWPWRAVSGAASLFFLGGVSED